MDQDGGLTHLKVKLSGTDLDWDVGRMVEIDRIATASAPNKDWSFSLDFNECCPDEDYVIDFLSGLNGFPNRSWLACSTSSNRRGAI